MPRSIIRNNSVLQPISVGLVLALWASMVCSPIITLSHAAPPAAVPGRSALVHPANSVATSAAYHAEDKNDRVEQNRLRESFGKLPLNFEANSGQTDARVKFFSRGSGYGLYLTPNEVLMVFGSAKPHANETRNAKQRTPGDATVQTKPKEQAIVRMDLVGANDQARLIGLEELPGKTNYFIGNDPKKWRTDVVNYRKVKYESVYPGVDMVYYGDQSQLEYDFIIAPHADPKSIKLKFNGATAPKVDRNGDLLLFSKSGMLRQLKPVIYQETNGGRTIVEGGYALSCKGRVSFRLGEYDASRPLIIDPVIAYSTFLGGSDLDEGASIAVDSSNNIYIAGITDSTNFPLSNPFQSINKGGNGPVGYYELFVSKLDPTGQFLVYSTYLGGTGIDRGGSIAVDSDGSLHITGSTTSTDFPVANAFQSTYGGGSSDAFLTKLSPAGNSLVYSTYLGGNGPLYLPGNYYEGGYEITTDTLNNAYLVGITDSNSFPTVLPLQSDQGGDDAFIVKLTPAGTVLFSTYMGGSNDEHASGVTLDPVGNILVAGSTSSTDFPVINAPSFLSGTADQNNAWVAQLTGNGDSIIRSTLIGGSATDYGGALAIDTLQNVYVGGSTLSRDFPVQNAFQPNNPTTDGAGDITGWVMKLQPDLSSIVYSTYLGGNAYGGISTIQVDSSNNAYLFGSTLATNFPVVDPIYASNRGYQDIVLSRFSPDGSTLTFSTYLGGANYDRQGTMVLNAAGDIFMTGSTQSLDFPLVNPYQQLMNGLSGHKQTYQSDAFIIRLSAQNELAISGTVSDGYGVGMGGVTVTLTGSVSKSALTLPNGRYLFNVPPGGSYAVQASKAPLSFLPASQSFNSITTSQVADFTVTNRTLSGQITDGAANGVEGVTVALSGSYGLSVQTDSAGAYSILAPLGGSYTLTPSKSGLLSTYVFTPATRTISNLSADTSGLNFTSSITYSESFYPLADAYVEDGASANINFGTASPLKVQTKNGSNRDVFFKFDTSSLSRKVINAKVRVFGAVSTSASISTSAYGVLSSNWIESGPGSITWNTAPARNSTAISGAAVVTGTTYAFYEIDVTSYVISEIAAGRSVMSLALHNPSQSTPYINLNSREAAANKPELKLITGDDNKVPTVSLSSPANGGQFTAPANIPLSATASDSDGTISKVEFFAGTSLVATATSAPYNATWNNAGSGSYSVVAVATDNRGASAGSAPAVITVTNANSPPAVTMTAPANLTTFPAGVNISLSALAADVDGTISKVEFFAGSTLVGTATVPVEGIYTVTWTNVNSGLYSLTAKATDNANAPTTSPAVTISVVAPAGLSPAADTYVRDGSSAATNFGTATSLQTQSSATAGNNRETYLKFDLTTVSGINRARLRLYGSLSDATGSNVPVGVYPVANTSWPESGSGSITWNNKSTYPSGGTAIATGVISDNVPRWYEWDITSYLATEKAAGRNVVSLVVKNTAQSSPFASFSSREATTNQPQLVFWSTQPRNALLVVGSTTLNSGDNAAKTRLQNLGYAVTVKAAGSNQNTAIKTSDADGKTLVLISSTVTPANVTNKFRNVAVPVLLWEFDILDDMGMTGLTSGTDFGTSSTAQTQLIITNANHPMAAGLSSTQTVVSTGTNFTWGKPNTNAARIATLTGDPTRFVIFGYDSQAPMPGLEAPARRVALFLTDTTAFNLNAPGGALFDAAVKWSTEVITGPVIYTLSPAFGPVGTSVVINGVNFGTTQGTSTTTFNGIATTPSSWSDKNIAVPVPLFGTTGAVIVTVSGVASNGVIFTVGDTDSDGDGLPDWWEMQYFGNLNQNSNGDPDGDGLTNLQEFQQGRNPTKSALPDDNAAVDLKVHTPLTPPNP